MVKTKNLKVIYTVLILTVFCILAVPVRSRADSDLVPAAVRCGVGGKSKAAGRLTVSLYEENYYIQNLKFSSNLIRGEINKTKKYAGKENLINGDICFYAKKAGTYMMEFDVYKASGKKYQSCSVKVIAADDYNDITKNLKSIAFNGKNISYKTDPYAYMVYTEKKSAKVNIKLINGCQIRKIEVVRRNQKGEEYTAAFKNNHAVNFGIYGEEYVQPEGVIKYQNACTRFMVTYYDSLVKEEQYLMVEVYTPAAKWAKISVQY